MRVLSGIAGVAFAIGAGAALGEDGQPRLWPYLVFLAGGAVAALAAGLRTGGVVFVRSGELEARPLLEMPDGYWEARPFRAWLALRNAAAAALAIFAGTGFLAFTDYFARAPRPSAIAILLVLGWLALLGRLSWAITKRTLAARAIEEARVHVRPRQPGPGIPFHVRVEQPVRRSARIWALEATLVCDRTVTKRPRHGKPRTRRDEAYRHRAVLATDFLAQPGLPARGEATFTVPAEAFGTEGYDSWRIEVRTRLTGPNYHSRFPLLARDDAEDEDE